MQSATTKVHAAAKAYARLAATALAAAIAIPLFGCHDNDDGPALLVPTSVVLAAGDGTITATWADTATADSYVLYWDDEASLTQATAERVADIVATQHTITGLQNGDTYYVAVASVNAGGESALSAVAIATLPPSAVASLTCTAGNGVVTISWDDVYGADTYNLYRATSPGVTPATGVKVADVTSPYADNVVVNDVAYYYVIEAVGSGGASPSSAQVAATPRAPLTAPTAVTVALVEEQPNTLQISWAPPLLGQPDSYNLYWDTNPGVTTADNQIAGVTSPFIHTGLAGRTTYYYVVTAVRGGFESDVSAEAAGTPRGSPGGGGGGGGHTEGEGNNLSFPVHFADGYGITGLPIDGTVDPWLDYNTGLRPFASQTLSTFPYFDPASAFDLNGVDYYEQQSLSTWQAGWRNGAAALESVTLDWGDNLTSANLRVNSAIRVETTLYLDDPLDPLDAYEMALLYGSGITEMQGTNGQTIQSTLRTVYALNARLRIQKLLSAGGAVDESVPAIDLSVADGLGGDGPGRYGAEINVAGKLVFGYIWRLRESGLTDAQKLGWWRISFVLDPQVEIGGATIPGSVTITALDPSETIATLAPNGKSSAIEVQLAQ